MLEATSTATQRADSAYQGFIVGSPRLELPKGGGAIRGIDEKFAAAPVARLNACFHEDSFSPSEPPRNRPRKTE